MSVRQRVVIVGPQDPFDGVRLYWSNAQGWVSRADATVFDLDEVPSDRWPLEATGTEVVATLA